MNNVNSFCNCTHFENYQSHLQKYHGLNFIFCSATLATKDYASEVNILNSIKLHNYAIVLFPFFIQAIYILSHWLL